MQAGTTKVITVQQITVATPTRKNTYVFWLLLPELDLPPLTGILRTMTEEPLGMRPSSSVYSEQERCVKVKALQSEAELTLEISSGF